MENSLTHHGVKGMKWGVRRYQNKDGTRTPAGKRKYRSTSLQSIIAKRSNDEVDKSFKSWADNSKKRDTAIELGKNANKAKMAYEADKNNKHLRDEYKKASKDYKKALKENTTYRKGVVRQDVGRDLARKYLSEAKKVEKQLKQDPNNKALQKQYNDLMSKHDVERAKARRATEVSSKRSRRIVQAKRVTTMTVKTVATTAAISAGVYAVNKYLNSRDVYINGKRVQLRNENVNNIVEFAKRAKDAMGYFY